MHHGRSASFVFELAGIAFEQRSRLELQANELAARVAAFDQPVGVDEPWSIIVWVFPDVLEQRVFFGRSHRWLARAMTRAMGETIFSIFAGEIGDSPNGTNGSATWPRLSSTQNTCCGYRCA